MGRRVFNPLNEMMETFNQEDQSFGIISKLMVFKVKRAEPRMSHASFVIMCSLVAVHLELLPIFLADLFSTRGNQI